MKIFFDLDGTILDSRRRIYQLFSNLTAQHTLGFEQYWEHKRQMRSNEWLLKNCLGYSEAKIAVFLDHWFAQIETESYLNLDILFEPIPAILRTLVNQGHMLYVVTARQSAELAQDQVKRIGIAPYITKTFVTGGQKAKHELLREIQVEPTDLFFGDTGLDVQTAKIIGVKSIAVLTGFRSKEILLSYQPDTIASSVWQYFAENPSTAA